MDTVVAMQADAPRRRGAKFKLTYRQICELSVAKGPVEEPQGSGIIVPRPPAEAGKPCRVLEGNQGPPTGFGFYGRSTSRDSSISARRHPKRAEYPPYAHAVVE